MSMKNEDPQTTAPAVCVIMPAYNASRFIEEAIQSVIDQTFCDWELIVIDDCSSDDTVAIVENLAKTDPRITLLRNEVNQGVAKTRNRGLDLCRSSYVALLDSDDIWHPEKLERQLRLAEGTGADILYCSYGIMDAEGNKAKNDYIVPPRTDFEKLLKENVIGCSTVMITSEIAKKYRFEMGFQHEDYVLWLRLLQNGHKACGCPEVLVKWRYIVNSRSFNKRRSAQDRWRIYRKNLKLPLFKSLRVFVSYAAASIRKYHHKGK